MSTSFGQWAACMHSEMIYGSGDEVYTSSVVRKTSIVILPCITLQRSILMNMTLDTFSGDTLLKVSTSYNILVCVCLFSHKLRKRELGV